LLILFCSSALTLLSPILPSSHPPLILHFSSASCVSTFRPLRRILPTTPQYSRHGRSRPDLRRASPLAPSHAMSVFLRRWYLLTHSSLYFARHYIWDLSSQGLPATVPLWDPMMAAARGPRSRYAWSSRRSHYACIAIGSREACAPSPRPSTPVLPHRLTIAPDTTALIAMHTQDTTSV
jgi:hypothetical protein